MIESAEDVETLITDFGEVLEAGGVQFHAIWGNPFVEVPSDESSVGSTDSAVIVTPTVAALVPEGAVLVRHGQTYRVSFHEPDETGAIVRLVLDRVTV